MRQIKTIDADTLTVISAYFRLRGEHIFLLESVPTDSEKSRYSIIALDPVHEFKTNGMLVTVDGQTSESKDPLLALQNLVVVQEQPVEELPFQGGAIGYVGFDTVACYEKLENQPKDELDMSDSHLFLYENFVIFDHRQEKIKIVVDNVYSGRQNLEHVVLAIENKLKLPVADELVPVKLHELNPKSNVTPEQFKEIVNHTKELIQEGDMFQMVPSQRFSFEFEDKTFDFYRQLRRTNPSPYMYYMDYGDYQIIGSSPESLVTVRGETVTTNPIAGTRKRGQTLTEDVAIAKELKTNEKELAEHRMLVDLGRNDLGKVSEYGSVKVTTLLEIQKYRYIMHLVSEVSGKLRAHTPAIEALKATLPAGTVSGAPKVRALQRIYEMEPVKRGVYAGAIGYLSRDNQMDFAIAIRTMVVKSNKGYVQAGAGIVYDSIAENEYQETLNKAKALLRVGGDV
ncbi:anthranilate synthase component I [Leuconostoc mesenteroides]|uniref:Anthranilate synthase component 1 n=1 Tax=Leuconostoc mesenteroides subsp. cremoris ATCC 19254 TaxID=586220 RepID=C2KIU6_LEUMC|nr:anthranilate synthase component I [Leuconostoc mesenteroides]EQC85040.1 anthranilate synthase subunit I [Leuconostoc mesenteroides subsp. cremoris TIFN8]KDA52036.1 Anthranilate synthase, aminase component [Leuconostoc mesenteroides subsp. cremoris T26]EEJ42838.1 anthranilate synthase component I [Leuconostoc mesenteroides subsp. cremoris ATCC 19254]MDG9750780.1 anthranilate synthase component I [Leuconostoc mesenteroides]ORI37822.1 anthranilate synthase component I [Leuconostoc mesenteroide